jgi:hypothetical protein
MFRWLFHVFHVVPYWFHEFCQELQENVNNYNRQTPVRLSVFPVCFSRTAHFGIHEKNYFGKTRGKLVIFLFWKLGIRVSRNRIKYPICSKMVENRNKSKIKECSCSVQSHRLPKIRIRHTFANIYVSMKVPLHKTEDYSTLLSDTLCNSESNRLTAADICQQIRCNRTSHLSFPSPFRIIRIERSIKRK